MTHALNLIRFTAVASIAAFAFAFNLAAMYAQVVYVFLPGTRVTGAPPMNWASAGSDVTNGLKAAGMGPIEWAIVAVCAAGCLYFMVKGIIERRAA